MHCAAGWRVWSFVKITTDAGIIGYSECTDSHGSAHGVAAVIADFGRLLVGKDPLAFERRRQDLVAVTRQSPGGIVQKAIGGVENALLDILGKHANLPIYALFGGPIRDRVPLYWSHWGTTRVRAASCANVKPIKDLEQVAELVAETKEQGFSALKTNVILFDPDARVYMPAFGSYSGAPELNASREIIAGTVAYLSAIRAAAGRGFDLMLDAGLNFRADGYIRMARALETIDLTWLEIDAYDPNALADIRSKSPMSICSGEDLYTARQYRPFFECRAMDNVNVDVVWNGFSESKRIANLADLYELNVSPHNHYSHFATFMSAQFCACIPNCRSMEIDMDDVPWKDDIVTKRPSIEKGDIIVPDGPGWGVDLNEKAIRAHPLNS